MATVFESNRLCGEAFHDSSRGRTRIDPIDLRRDGRAMQPHYNMIAGGEVGRIAALSDGLFAIAATILVLDFHTPEPTAIHSETELLHALAASAITLSWTGAPGVTATIERKTYCGSDDYVSVATTADGVATFTDSTVQLGCALETTACVTRVTLAGSAIS